MSSECYQSLTWVSVVAHFILYVQGNTKENSVYVVFDVRLTQLHSLSKIRLFPMGQQGSKEQLFLVIGVPHSSLWPLHRTFSPSSPAISGPQRFTHHQSHNGQAWGPKACCSRMPCYRINKSLLLNDGDDI